MQGGCGPIKKAPQDYFVYINAKSHLDRLLGRWNIAESASNPPMDAEMLVVTSRTCDLTLRRDMGQEEVSFAPRGSGRRAQLAVSELANALGGLCPPTSISSQLEWLAVHFRLFTRWCERATFRQLNSLFEQDENLVWRFKNAFLPGGMREQELEDLRLGKPARIDPAEPPKIGSLLQRAAPYLNALLGQDWSISERVEETGSTRVVATDNHIAVRIAETLGADLVAVGSPRPEGVWCDVGLLERAFLKQTPDSTIESALELVVRRSSFFRSEAQRDGFKGLNDLLADSIRIRQEIRRVATRV